MHFTGENRTSTSDSVRTASVKCGIAETFVYIYWGIRYSLGNHVRLWRVANMVLIQILPLKEVVVRGSIIRVTYAG